MIRKNLALGVLTVGLLLSGLLQAQKTDPQSTTEKFGTLLYYIEQMYVDSVDAEALTEKAIRGMLEELDPHSSYISSSDVQDANAPLKGNFDGIGIQFNILKEKSP